MRLRQLRPVHGVQKSVCILRNISTEHIPMIPERSNQLLLLFLQRKLPHSFRATNRHDSGFRSCNVLAVLLICFRHFTRMFTENGMRSTCTTEHL